MDIYFHGTMYSCPDNITACSGKVYTIGEELGKGGNGIVFTASDIYGDEFAIKFLISNDTRRKKRFEREIKILQENSVSESWGMGLLTYKDSGECELTYKNNKNKYLFVVTEKCDNNLFKYVQENHPFVYSKYAGQFLNLARGLQSLHSRNIIHRDIKPENILISGDNWIIADFGLCYEDDIQDEISEITRDGEIVGPKLWMSPEASNNLVDNTIKPSNCSDIFQMAAVFWFVINKTIPVGIVNEEDWQSDDDNFKNLILRSLKYNKSKRPQNGDEFFKELERIIEQE